MIAPNMTPETRITWEGALALKRWLTSQGFSPIALFGPQARKLYLISSLAYLRATENPPYLVYYAGHGFPGSLVGQEGPLSAYTGFGKLIQAGVSDLFYQDCIIFSFACSNLEVLGKRMVDRGGVLAYFGSTIPMWTGEFDTPYDKDKENDFHTLQNSGIMSLAQGKTIGEAYQDFIFTANYFMDIYQKNYDFQIDKTARDVYGWFKTNRDNYQVLGDISKRWIF